MDSSTCGGGGLRIDRDWHERIVITDGRHIELRYLTECDGTDHFAVAAVGRDKGGQRLLIGVACCKVRMRTAPDDPDLLLMEFDLDETLPDDEHIVVREGGLYRVLRLAEERFLSLRRLVGSSSEDPSNSTQIG